MAVTGLAIAGGTLLGGYLSSQGAQGAANTQAAASAQAAQIQAQSMQNQLDFQKQMWGTSQANLAPWIQSGYGANNALNYAMGLSPSAPPGTYGSGTAPQTSAIPQLNVPGVTNTGYVGTTAAPAGTYAGGGQFAQMPAGGGGVGGMIGGLLKPGQGSNPAPPQYITTKRNHNLPARSMPNPAYTTWLQQQVAANTAPAQAAPQAAPIQAAPVQAAQAAPQLGQPMGGNPSIGYGQLTHQFNNQDLATNLAPNYQFQLGQGEQQLQASAAARGMLLSGQGLKDINNYAQDYAGNAYQNAFSNYTTNQNNLFNRLNALSTTGQASAAGVGAQAGQVGANAANIMQSGTQGITNNLTSGAAAQAAGQVGSANAWNNTLGSLGNTYMTQQMMNRIYPQQTAVQPSATIAPQGSYVDLSNSGSGYVPYQP
jgi:hypothetical protein